MVVDPSGPAATYDRVRSAPREVQEFWLPAVGLQAGLAAGSRVLDVGCGTGRLAVPLSARCAVVGLDRSREMLAVARAKGSPAAFVLGDAGRLPFMDRSFDVALAVMVLHLLPDFRAAVREMARVAVRGVIATIDMDARTKHAIDEAFPSFHGIDAARFPRIPALAEACREAGWNRVEVQGAHRRIESSTSEFLDRVRSRYVSTLTLLPPGEFERGLAWLEAELPKRGDRYAYDHTVTFVVASR
jgi:ubiquinone/menaquinone biosynthesis C-methylase UbiE